jgi:prepilin-type N-terminal cleavage/methylation domain-containing protein
MYQYKKITGFTLIELLAVIVILALVMLIVIPNTVAFIESKKKETFAGAAELMIANARVKVAEDTSIILPQSNNEATLIKLSYLKIQSISKDVDGSLYSRNNSYVLIVKTNNKLVYYVTLVGSLRHLSLVREGEIDADEVIVRSITEYTSPVDVSGTYTIDGNTITVTNVYPIVNPE